MKLISAKIGPFKSINSPQNVEIGDGVTALVGMNEAGKTVFLQALEKSNDALNLAKFKPVDDYPRKDLTGYLKRHKEEPEEVVSLTYCPSDSEIKQITDTFGAVIKAGFQFTVIHKYDNTRSISLSIDEARGVAKIIDSATLSSDAKTALKGVTSLRQIPEILSTVNLTEGDQAFLTQIESRIGKQTWTGVIGQEVWRELDKNIPKFLYFGEYDLLPSKMNLADLTSRQSNVPTNPAQLTPKHRAILALLRMADISLEEFSEPSGYEELKARIEGVSISLTDQIKEFWKQNEDLEVEVDIKTDPQDEAPFNNGPNIYLRIKNKRHRGVSTPFEQRSRGFIWFFSFLVWFDSVEEQLDNAGKVKNPILLLDEPGLALHALAQRDFLRYIDQLAEVHQVIYTTHSPFMVDAARLQDIRVVEDKIDKGTTITSDLASSNPRTLFPLQAALGWTMAQNLFISSKNLLVEGPSELILFKRISSALEAADRRFLFEHITIVPTGGLDKVATFVALLGGNELEFVVFHDYKGTPEQRLVELTKEKLLGQRDILNASQFRDLENLGTAKLASDIEDLFEPSTYLAYFNSTYATKLPKKGLSEKELESGDRIVDRINRTLEEKNIKLRPSGGFNHYLVASKIAEDPNLALSEETLGRFEALFAAINKRFE